MNHSPSNPTQRDLTRDQNCETVERLVCEGVPRGKIAQQLRMSPDMLEDYLETLSQRWLALVQARFDDLKAREVAKINNLEAVAWQAWERSCRDQETTKVVIQNDEKRRSEKTIRTQSGNASFLNRISWCIERRCRLLGLQAPPRSAQRHDDEPQDVDALRMQIVDFITAFDEQAAVGALEESSGGAGASDGDPHAAASG